MTRGGRPIGPQLCHGACLSLSLCCALACNDSRQSLGSLERALTDAQALTPQGQLERRAASALKRARQGTLKGQRAWGAFTLARTWLAAAKVQRETAALRRKIAEEEATSQQLRRRIDQQRTANLKLQRAQRRALLLPLVQRQGALAAKRAALEERQRLYARTLEQSPDAARALGMDREQVQQAAIDDHAQLRRLRARQLAQLRQDLALLGHPHTPAPHSDRALSLDALDATRLRLLATIQTLRRLRFKLAHPEQTRLIAALAHRGVETEVREDGLVIVPDTATRSSLLRGEAGQDRRWLEALRSSRGPIVLELCQRIAAPRVTHAQQQLQQALTTGQGGGAAERFSTRRIYCGQPHAQRTGRIAGLRLRLPLYGAFLNTDEQAQAPSMDRGEPRARERQRPR